MSIVQVIPPPSPAYIAEQLRGEEARIQYAYWRFTRGKNAPPPVLAVPDAYERKEWLERVRKAGRMGAY